MQPNRYKIQINNPCSENWELMKSDQTGRFCDSCQKSVIDFTNKSDAEISAFVSTRANEQLCGRFFPSQLDRIQFEINVEVLYANIPFWQKFLVILLICFGPEIAGYHFVFAQESTDTIPKIEQTDSLLKPEEELVVADSLSIDSIFSLSSEISKEFQTTCTIFETALSGFMIIEPHNALPYESEVSIFEADLEKDTIETTEIQDTIFNEANIDEKSKMPERKKPKKSTVPESSFIAPAMMATRKRKKKSKKN